MNRFLIFDWTFTCFTQLGWRKISKHIFDTMFYWCCVTKKIVTWHTQRNEERTNSYLSFTGKDRRLQSQSIDNESGNWIKWKMKLNIISLFRYLDGKPCSMNKISLHRSTQTLWMRILSWALWIFLASRRIALAWSSAFLSHAWKQITKFTQMNKYSKNWNCERIALNAQILFRVLFYCSQIMML